MSALIAIGLAILGGFYVALPGLRRSAPADLIHEVDPSTFGDQRESEITAVREWSLAAGEMDPIESTIPGEGEGA